MAADYEGATWPNQLIRPRVLVTGRLAAMLEA